MNSTYKVQRAKTVKSRKAVIAPWVRIIRTEATEYEAALLTSDSKLRGPADVHRLLAQRAAVEEVEVFYVIALNSQSRPIALQEVTRGILNSSLVHPREVFRAAIAFGAAGIIVAHNHPSGDPTPSADNRSVTRQLVDAGRLLDVPVYDHVVIAGNRFTSFAEAGLL